MKVKVRSDALELFLLDNYGQVSDYWEQIFEKISGKILEVDTEILFEHEFNIKPIPGITNTEIRVFDDYVEKVIDDERNLKPEPEEEYTGSLMDDFW